MTIIGRGWAKYRHLSVASRSIICGSRRLRQIIDLQDTHKSWYFAITEFNNCFIIRSPSLFSYFSLYLQWDWFTQFYTMWPYLWPVWLQAWRDQQNVWPLYVTTHQLLREWLRSWVLACLRLYNSYCVVNFKSRTYSMATIGQEKVKNKQLGKIKVRILSGGTLKKVVFLGRGRLMRKGGSPK